ncbi:hypothetical protein GCM10023176_62580 [Micromonospora coerulea]|uniref:Uncharacterized protein n=1 Tax=Micromonospora coerulea TaxID=47856 RepID=A0ABP8T6V6_9ACTN
MFVLVKDAAQAFTPTYVEAGDLPWIGDRPRQGVQRSGVRDALMRPMGVVEPLELPEGLAKVRWFQIKVRSSNSRRQVCTLPPPKT